MQEKQRIGFIGLGVMGEPICRNLVAKSGLQVRAFDTQAAPLERLRAQGVEAAGSVREVAADANVIFFCLPSGKHVESICDGPDGLLAQARPGQTMVDLGTSPISLARRLQQGFAARGASFADAPIARTRQAAQEGTLSVMVGSDAACFARLRPLIECFASDITHCGEAGAGQAVKILNNMVLMQTVNALAEALAMGRKVGIAPDLLLSTLSKGSADSFALRNHGMKAMAPGVFPEQAFSAEYARKDIDYALQIAAETGVQAPGAELVGRVLQQAIDAGYGKQYWPVLARVVDKP
jgi:hypothetical protein